MKPVHHSEGFSLVELMLTLAIVGIIAAVAYPSYLNQVQKSRRSDAITTLLKVQLEQEKYRANNTTYATMSTLGLNGDSSEGYYTIADRGTPDANTYGVTATPKSGGPQSSDSCGTYALNQDGPYYSGYASRDCWQSVDITHTVFEPFSLSSQKADAESLGVLALPRLTKALN